MNARTRRRRDLSIALTLAGVLVACSCASSERHTRSAAREQPVRAERTRPAPPPEPAPLAAAAVALYELGDLPPELGEVRWPVPPRTTREEELDGSQPRCVIDQAGTRVTVHGALEELTLAADDIDVHAAEDARIAHLVIRRGAKRIRISGGRYGFIELPVPAQFVPGPPRFRPEWLAEDITIDGVDVVAPESAIFVRGRRVAIVNSRTHAERYSIWAGDTGDFQSEDIVIAGNRFESAGPESTVRLVSVRHAVVVDNTLSNTFKHDFRVHGTSDDVVFARNRLIRTGIMVGSMPEDRIGSVWILDNELHHHAPSLIEVSPERVRFLAAHGNRIFSDRWHCFVCEHQLGSGWDVRDNRVSPYRPAPESWARR